MNLPNPYEKPNYKWLAVLPIVLVLVSLYLIFFVGIPRGIDFKGGTLVSLQVSGSVDQAALKSALSKYSDSVSVTSVSSPVGTGLEIQLGSTGQLQSAEDTLSDMLSLDSQLSDAEVALGTALAGNQSGTAEKAVVDQLTGKISADATVFYSDLKIAPPAAGTPAHEVVRKAQDDFTSAQNAYQSQVLATIKSQVNVQSYSFNQVGSSLSRSFLAQTQQIVLYAFILCAIVVFVVFRSLVPSLAVITGAVSDIVITAGAMVLFGIPLTLASVATLLMLIGFSLDTDVMLAIRVLRRKEGKAAERAFEAMKTGFLMNFTTIGAFGALLAIAYWLQIPTYEQIGKVAVIGGVVDFFATWCLDAVIILSHVQGKEKQAVQ